jgi:hypothetical protein
MSAPLAIDLCCGLGGWTEGLLAEGWRVRGYDIEAHEYGEERYPAELVLRNVLEMHGSEIADADLIVASPPCTEYSYMAMPWSRAKQIAAALRGEGEFPDPYRGSRTVEQLTAIFDACFRIQREASEAAGRPIPMVVENVKGAQPWVGRAAWAFGSFFLWGDIPALMPIQKYRSRLKVKAGEQWNVNQENFTGTRGWDDEGQKNTGGSWFNIGSPGQKVTGQNPVHALASEGVKVPSQEGRRTDPGKGARFTSRDCGEERREGVKFSQSGAAWFDGKPRDKMLGELGPAAYGSKSPQRKAASAKIAKIPLALSSHIARVYRPQPSERAA